MTGLEVLKLPLAEQRAHFANERIKALQAFAATVMAPPAKPGLFTVRYKHRTLGDLTVHYLPDQDDPSVQAVYLFSRDISELLGTAAMDDIAKECAKVYAKACAESNLDLQIERKHG